MADGGLGTLGNDTSGYLHIPRGPATPPDSVYSGVLDSLPGSTVGVTEEAREEESQQERLMRPEGRHHLVDIHGLAVFLRRSTRCLSCRAAFCLYVTGKISAQLAAVTQVKITCQKCNYTTSQILSKPAGTRDSPSPQNSTPAPPPPPPPVPPTPPDASTPPARPPPPSYPGKPRHQTVIRLLKEENLTKKEAQKKASPVPGLLPLQPIEKVWVKEEDKQVNSPSPKPDVEVSEDGDVVISSPDPLLTEWCHLAGTSTSAVSSSSSSSLSSSPSLSSSSSTSSSSQSRHVSSSNGVSSSAVATATSRVSPPTLQPCATPLSPHAKPHTGRRTPDAAPTTSTTIQRHLTTLQETNALPKGVSIPSANPFSMVPNPCPPVMPSEGLFTMLSGTSAPYTLPIASSILQGNVAAAQDSPQLLQAIEIKQKLERDLEESLRLVRRMIQLDPDAVPPSGKRNKETRSAKVYQESPRQPQVYGAPGDALVGSLQPAVMPGEPLTEGDGGGGVSLRSKERRKATVRSTPRSRGVKKESGGRKAARGRARRSRKRGGGSDEKDNEAKVKRRRKSAQASSSQTLEVQQDASQGPLTPSATPAASQQCPTKTERSLGGVEHGLYDTLHHSLPGDTKRQEREGYTKGGSHSQPRLLQEPHAFPIKHNSSPPSSTSDLTLRSNPDAWRHAQRIPEGHTTRKRQRKSTKEESQSELNQTIALAQILTSLQQGAHSTLSPAGVKEDTPLSPAPGAPDHLLDTLQKNLSLLVQKDSLRLALRSLVRRKHTSRSSKSRKYVKISLGLDEEAEAEEEAMKGHVSSAGGREKEEAGQEEGRTATWRFHDLLSSDDSDTEDDRLVIDAE